LPIREHPEWAPPLSTGGEAMLHDFIPRNSSEWAAAAFLLVVVPVLLLKLNPVWIIRLLKLPLHREHYHAPFMYLLFVCVFLLGFVLGRMG
jgi:hypothetical protein